jgi:hypothetical protein
MYEFQRARATVQWANSVYSWLESLSRRKLLMCVLAMTLPMATRLILLPRLPIPKPYVSDEFGYLLSAETFASGRLTNPPHPMWQHFETLHQLMQPTYNSKYPPGQAIFLAVGIKVLGNAWFGVWLVYGLFGASLCWMLQNWVPPVYALFGTLITLVRISILGYWMNSYWGGALAACAGCLLLGTLPRMAQGPVRSKDAALAAMAIVLLANTRPFEGLILAVGMSAALLIWRATRRLRFASLLTWRALTPILMILAAAAIFDGYYNLRVTGSALCLPYQSYFEQYQLAPPWIILSERNHPTFRHADLENTWKEEESVYQANRTRPIHNIKETLSIFKFFCPTLYFFPIVVALLLCRSIRLWAAVGIYCFTWAGLLIEGNKAPHYIAVSACLMPLIVVYGLRSLRVISGAYGNFLVLTLIALIVLQGRAPERGFSFETRGQATVSNRMIVLDKLKNEPGPHLVLVRYSPDHIDKSDGCVYNAPNIDTSKIVWALDMGQSKNQELLDYYHESRKIWLYQPDQDPSVLAPYTENP